MGRVTTVFAIVAALVLCACDGAPRDDSPTLGFTVASGVTIPAAEELKGRIDAALRQPEGSKGYVMQSSRWVATTMPPVAKRANATVRSYSASEGAAFVEVVLPEHKTWVLQVWHFDGTKWSNAIAPAPTRPSS